MLIKRIIIAAAVLVMLSSTTANAAAQTTTEPAPCTGDSVTGTLLNFDSATGTAVIRTETGECTVKVGSDNEHPIVKLFEDFFGGDDEIKLEDVLDDIEGFVALDAATGNWSWVTEDTPGAVEVRVTAVTDNNDGSFTLAITNEQGEELTTIVKDLTLAERLAQGLDALEVEWDLVQDAGGNPIVEDIGEEIAGYHEDGMGFGVLAKLMGIVIQSSENCTAQAGSEDGNDCEVTLGDLVALKQEGMGIGQIFDEYLKPSILGVGHIRQALEDEADGDESTIEAGNPGKSDKHDQDSSLEDVDDDDVDDDTEDSISSTMDQDDADEDEDESSDSVKGNQGKPDKEYKNDLNNFIKNNNGNSSHPNKNNPGKPGKNK